jgi:hypothetical protein
MKFENVCIESLAVALPDEVWSSAAIEERLRPLYERLKLPAGRLELMSGIRERRMWPAGTRPSDASAQAGRAVLAKSALDAGRVELFVHAAVSRDMLEPATAAFAQNTAVSRLVRASDSSRLGGQVVTKKDDPRGRALTRAARLHEGHDDEARAPRTRGLM